MRVAKYIVIRSFTYFKHLFVKGDEIYVSFDKDDEGWHKVFLSDREYIGGVRGSEYDKCISYLTEIKE